MSARCTISPRRSHLARAGTQTAANETHLDEYGNVVTRYPPYICVYEGNQISDMRKERIKSKYAGEEMLLANSSAAKNV